MFKKAFPYDDEVVFYFDKFDNKFVANGGSLAWRLNNPGLIHSRSGVAVKNGSIGSYQKYAIFPDLNQGEKALIAWLLLKTNFNSNLKTLAKHYQPENHTLFLDKLCVLASLTPEVRVSSLTKKQFDSLIWSIKKLSGFSKTGDENFNPLPKITSRFCSGSATEDLYLVGNDQYLTKQEAITWVKTHRLDAVIVNRKDGVINLRSRPGHHFRTLSFTTEEYGEEIEFESIVRDTGIKRESQCVWGFINGIKNRPDCAKRSANLISSHIDNEQVWSLINDEKLLGIGDLGVCVCLKLTVHTPIVKLATRFFRFLLEISKQDSKPVIVIAHSQGALISDIALENLSQEERRKIRIFTFGGASYIHSDKAHPDSHNFVSPHDLIPRIASFDFSSILFRREAGYKNGKNDQQIILELVDEDIDYYLDTRNPDVVEVFRTQCERKYEEWFKHISNVTILEENSSGSWEHSFDIPCYQIKLKEILHSFKMTP